MNKRDINVGGSFNGIANTGNNNSFQDTLNMSGDRVINTGGGDYYESINTSGGNFVQGNHIDMSQDLTRAATQIQELLVQLQKHGVAVDAAQEEVAADIADQARKDPTVRTKLLKWGQSLGDATVTDIVKGIIKLAIQSAAGITLP